MLLQRGPFTVVETGAPQLAVIKIESEWPYQVQDAAGIGAKAYDVAGIRGNLRLVEHHMKHSWIQGNSRP